MAAHRNFRAIWGKFCALIMLGSMMTACVSADGPRIVPRPPADRPVSSPPPSQTTMPAPPPRTSTPPRSAGSIDPALQQFIFEEWRKFPGKTGVAVLRIDGTGLVGQRLTDLFPQQSVSKTWVALTVLDQVDQGKLSLNQNVRITPDDVAVFYQPLGDRVTREGVVNESIARLLELAITSSDNTANDNLLRVAGGPDAVRAFIGKHGLGQIRFGPGERLLQSGIAGMEWRQEYSVGRRFYAARDAVPYDRRKAALDAYLANPVDGASPEAIANALARLARGELLSASSTRLMLSLMEQVKSGPNRLKAGVPAGWRFGHKTGTGQILPPVSTGYNDIGIMTAPDGTRYAVVVMMADTTASVPERMQFMQSISRATANLHQP
ncbi:serine hydrolase [Sphingorhabdus arenilitoris]|uniref:beta-lactamase n=1 Tax=Sphingorhabdus arenilitoris TaxID=1490041 RepID=A0ABV8RK34_9SPHN